MSIQTDTFSKWILGIAAVASAMYGGWLGNEIASMQHSLGVLEGRPQVRCGQ